MMGRGSRTHEGMKGALTVLVGVIEGNEPLESYLFIGKCIFKELRVRMTSVFTRLQAETTSVLCEHGDETSGHFFTT